MRNASIFVSFLFALSVASRAQGGWRPPPPPAAKLIRAGRVLDVKSGKPLLDQGILTEGEKIKVIGSWAEVQAHAPKDTVIIDLSQATLLPGLIDCHAHPLIAAELGRMDPWEIITTTITQMSVPLRTLMGARNAKEVLDVGITSARVLGHSGIEGDVALRDAIRAGWIPGPRLQAAGRKITALGAMYLQPAVATQVFAQEFLVVSGTDEARRAVRENLANGADLIKIEIDAGSGRNGKTRYMAIEDAKAIVEDAHRLGVKVAAHAQDNTAVQIAIDAGVDSIEHAWTATDEQLKQMKDKGIFLVATEIYVNKSPKDRMQRAMKIGVKIAMGSDAWTSVSGKTRGETSLFNLRRLQDEGMPNIDIIRSSTINAAELMGWSEQVGELAVGKFADIIAVAGDPVEEIGLLQRVQFVMKGATVVRNDFAKN
jgi:imidazolonepropionase-like amidohydrolase